uniref:Uncharacterized protein n=1 Tax=Wuchereria bancrofti TaxID=6293 RepID=A0AAF5PGI9_WUCBA
MATSASYYKDLKTVDQPATCPSDVHKSLRTINRLADILPLLRLELELHLKNDGREEQSAATGIVMACEMSLEVARGWVHEATKTKYDILEWEKLREKGNGSLNGRVWEFPRQEMRN